MFDGIEPPPTASTDPTTERPGEARQSRGDGGNRYADTETPRPSSTAASGQGSHHVDMPSAPNRVGRQSAPPPPRGTGGAPRSGAGDGSSAGRIGLYPCYTDTRSPTDKPAAIAIYEYPNGAHEGVAFVQRTQTPNANVDSWWQKLEAKDRDKDNLRRTGRRAQVDIQRRIRSNDYPDLLTWTNGAPDGGWQTPYEALSDVRAWLRAGGAEYFPRGLVVAPEAGEKHGRWHVHAATDRRGLWLPYREIIDSWSAFLTARGYVTATGTHRFTVGEPDGKHAEGFSSADACAYYVSSYMTKTVGEGDWCKGQRRWFAIGAEIPKPAIVTGLRMSEVPQILHDTFGVSLTTTDTKRPYVKPYTTPDGEIGGYWFDDKGRDND